MFFMLSKILGFFALPSNFIISLGILGALLLRTRFARAGWRLIVASLLVLAVIGLSPVSNAMMFVLEQRFPPWDPSHGAPDGFIVLGGMIDPAVSAARGTPALNEAAERLTAIAELSRRYPQARILFSGGSAHLIEPRSMEADHAFKVFESFGIARNRILLENRSRNTAENALFSKQLAAPKAGERWLLVTSAHHMPRAMACFRRVGFAVEAYPVDWRTGGGATLIEPFGSLASGLARTDAAAKEYVGLLVYWLSGRTLELWPGP